MLCFFQDVIAHVPDYLHLMAMAQLQIYLHYLMQQHVTK